MMFLEILLRTLYKYKRILSRLSPTLLCFHIVTKTLNRPENKFYTNADAFLSEPRMNEILFLQKNCQQFIILRANKLLLVSLEKCLLCFFRNEGVCKAFFLLDSPFTRHKSRVLRSVYFSSNSIL